jgi:hypothetical protein
MGCIGEGCTLKNAESPEEKGCDFGYALADNSRERAPGVGAICRYFEALSVPCKLLKKSNLQFLPQESHKFFTLFSQNWMPEIHTA